MWLLLKVKNGLHDVFLKKNQIDKAEKMLRDLGNIYKDIYGDQSKKTLIVKFRIARCLFENKEYDNAKKMWKEVGCLQKEVLGEKHGNTVNTKHWIAMSYVKNEIWKTQNKKAEK